MLNDFIGYVRDLFTSQPIAAWTAVLALVTTLAIVIPLLTQLGERWRVDKTQRLLLLVLLRTMRDRLGLFMQDMGSPAEQYYAGFDLMISKAFSVEVARTLTSRVVEKAYDAALHAYGRMLGAEEWKRKNLFGPLQVNLNESKQLVEAAIKRIDPHASLTLYS